MLVVPRIGTVSPWSSKATDIAHSCGLTRVRRIERGILYIVVGEVVDEAALRRALHDRMTESMLDHVGDAARLFEHAAPRPLGARRAGRGRPRRARARERDARPGAVADDEIDYLVDAYARRWGATRPTSS